ALRSARCRPFVRWTRDERPRHHLGAARHAQPAVNDLYVIVNRVRGEPEVRRDPLLGRAGEQEGEGLAFARAPPAIGRRGQGGFGRLAPQRELTRDLEVEEAKDLPVLLGERRVAPGAAEKHAVGAGVPDHSGGVDGIVEAGRTPELRDERRTVPRTIA